MGLVSIHWEDSACTAVGFLFTLMYHMYMCLNICIALNLFLVILCNKRPKRRWELYYWAVSFILPLLLDVPLLAAGVFGKSGKGRCGIVQGTAVNDIIHLIYNVVSCSITIVYCLLISVWVVYKVKSEKFDQSMESLTNPTDLFHKENSLLSFRSLICRTCLYPISCFLAYVGSNFSGTYYFIVKQVPDPISAWGRFGFCSRGILHFFSFIADPLVFKAVSNFFRNRRGADGSDSQLKFYQFEATPDCEYSYEHLVGPSADTLSPSLKKMIHNFRKYI
ncbi:hypothetical protein DSO57_1001061 [Entomophthora muscae]|uniref:Uncharacterized protein n=1 Tax=Entomophthora muscae TaxID=34485 RepID=A0ACC2RP06_9FUNG|nr:hypothetical protein DSO57_1001061 [Entomophthora muscae]